MDTDVSKQANDDRMKELVELLNQAIQAYYMLDTEIMTNHEYDKLFYELEQLEAKSGVHLPDSPVGTVGYTVMSELEKVQHVYPAKSLDKTKSQKKLVDWLDHQAGILSYKLDGLTMVLTYREGELVSAVTRGDGFVGENVMHNVKYVDGVPFRIDYLDELTVRGEVVIRYDDFDEINLSFGDNDYANPRNLASSSLRLLDSQKARGRRLKFIAFEYVNAYWSFSSFQEALFKLKSYGFSVVNHVLVSQDNLYENMNMFTQRVKDRSFDYPVDGMVLVYNDLRYAKTLGETAHHPKWMMAFKWKDTEAETILRDIEWSGSRTGVLTPVAIFDEVSLEGTKVSRASLHNLGIYKSLKLGIGDTLTVYKANMIIPQVSENLTQSDTLGVPRTCPYCGSKLSVIKSDNSDTEIIKCLDPNCPAKSIGKFECMVGKTGLDVKGMSRSTVDQFVKLGLLSSYSDLFDLRDHRDMLIKLVGFGEKSIDKLLSGIETARETTFVKFFCSLGIPNCGRHVAGVLDRYLGMDHTSKSKVFLNLFADDLVMAYDVLVKLDGIGPEIADGMTEWFYEHYDETVAYLSRLHIIDDIAVCENKDDSGVLSGKSFVITGKLELYKNRKSLELDIKAHGGMVMSAVSKNTDYLICNQDLGSSKSKKAKELGVSVITEQEYQALVEG